MKMITEEGPLSKGDITVRRSVVSPGNILVEVTQCPELTGNITQANIRLTRNQARELGQALFDIADSLYFEHLQVENEEKKQEDKHG